MLYLALSQLLKVSKSFESEKKPEVRMDIRDGYGD